MPISKELVETDVLLEASTLDMLIVDLVQDAAFIQARNAMHKVY